MPDGSPLKVGHHARSDPARPRRERIPALRGRPTARSRRQRSCRTGTPPCVRGAEPPPGHRCQPPAPSSHPSAPSCPRDRGCPWSRRDSLPQPVTGSGSDTRHVHRPCPESRRSAGRPRQCHRRRCARHRPQRRRWSPQPAKAGKQRPPPLLRSENQDRSRQSAWAATRKTSPEPSAIGRRR